MVVFQLPETMFKSIHDLSDKILGLIHSKLLDTINFDCFSVVGSASHPDAHSNVFSAKLDKLMTETKIC